MRFWNYLVYDFNHTLKEKIIFGSVIFAAIIIMAVCVQAGGTIASLLFALICPLLIVFYCFGAQYQASHFGLPFRQKQTSIQFLMLPASTTEKFFSRMINQCIVPTIIALLAVALSLGILYLINSFVDLNLCKGIAELERHARESYQNAPEGYRIRMISIISVFALVLFVSGLVTVGEMMVGSLIFGKYAFLKTFIIFSIISSLVTSLFIDQQTIMLNSMNAPNEPETVLRVFESIFNWDFIIGHIIVALVLFVVSYILFRRKTIIKTGL